MHIAVLSFYAISVTVDIVCVYTNIYIYIIEYLIL